MPDDESNPRYRVYRWLCTALDILPLVTGGWLAPGIHSGTVKSLAQPGPFGGVSIEFSARMGQNDGVLVVSWPAEQAIRLRRVDTKAGHRWLFVCDGEGPVHLTRRLLLPQTPPGIGPVPWTCGPCRRVVYDDPRRTASPRPRMADVDRLQAELDRIRRSILAP
jgi:hypothetical protein